MSSSFLGGSLAQELTAAFTRHGARVHCETTPHGVAVKSSDERVDATNAYFASIRFEASKSC